MDYLNDKRSLYHTIIAEKEDVGYLTPLIIGGDEFLGRWFDSWLPEESPRYQHLMLYEGSLTEQLRAKKRRVFQGLRRDIYDSGLEPEPFSRPLIETERIRMYTRYEESGASVFSDGTVMMFRQI
jgi:hypothetical protein